MVFCVSLRLPCCTPLMPAPALLPQLLLVVVADCRGGLCYRHSGALLLRICTSAWIVVSVGWGLELCILV